MDYELVDSANALYPKAGWSSPSWRPWYGEGGGHGAMVVETHHVRYGASHSEKVLDAFPPGSIRSTRTRESFSSVSPPVSASS